MQLKIFTLAGAAALALAACTAKEKPTQDDTAGAATTGGVTREEAKVEPDAPPVTPMPAATVIQSQPGPDGSRSEEHTSELQSLMRLSYAVFCLKKKKPKHNNTNNENE